MVDAILIELELRRDYLQGQALGSIYFGGGTPSLLDLTDLEKIFNKINSLYQLLPDAEITLEANPDDLTPEKIRDLKNYTPVNRLSIGIQSFADADLQWMNRAHTARHAQACLEGVFAAGFQDITIDLIYGAPTTPDAQWAENLNIAMQYDLPHLSCYCLTVEEGTALGSFVRKGLQPPVDEERAARQFEYLVETMAQHGYEHYEISNFAKPGHYARHNSSYWNNESYLGVGPAAHSFDGISRQWNVANNAAYIKSMGEGKTCFEREVLTQTQRYNEYLMTAFRTIWGVEEAKIQAFGAPYSASFTEMVQPFLMSGTIERLGGNYRLSRAGKLLADRVVMELFVSDASF
jgi:oxygen-independent coproporphyrinogen-3 oxidase